MKHKKNIATAIALLISCMLIFTACGASSSNDQASPAASSDASYGIMMETSSTQDAAMTAADKSGSTGIPGNGLIVVANQDRKIVKHSYLNLETKEFDSALEQIIAAINEQGGYI